MSILLADIDATCAALGFDDGEKYYTEPDALQGLKHLIWILRRDLDNHEYRRHLGKSQALKTDLVPMLCENFENEEIVEVLIRLLVVLTNPTLLLYREGLPKDGAGRKIYLELIDILQGYKEAFVVDKIWGVLGLKLHKCLDTDWALRSEEQGLLIERILVLVRNVLQIPANPEAECRADNDASIHDQVIWALQQSGMLDLVLYILSSADENQYHLHALEIVCLLYREQTASSLADASLHRSADEKHRDEQELIAVRRREKQKLVARPPPGRHSRFGGTYVLQNVKSVSDKDIICHQSLERAVVIDFDREKTKQKTSHRHVIEDNASERRSAFSVRLFLREYCIEILRSAYNTLVRQIRRVLERNSVPTNHDDSYLLWAIKFFMEFNRLCGLQLELVSESLSIQCFHWILTRIQHHMDMMDTDKSQARLWGKRLHVAVQTFRELLLSMIALQKLKDNKAPALYQMLLNNVCYVLEYRETVLHLLMQYNETKNTKAYLRDVVETANIFIKMMEKFCKDPVVVQEKRRRAKKAKNKTSKKQQRNPENEQENLEDTWAGIASQVASVLANNIELPEEEHPIPFDAASDKNIDDQKEDCMLRIYKFLHEEKFEQAILLTRSAREVWPENDCFGAMTAAPEDELMLLREIFISDIAPIEKNKSEDDKNSQDDNESDDDEDDEEHAAEYTEKDFRFEDFAKRLVNPRVVRSCTVVLSDWEKIKTTTLKSAVTILHKIAYGCKSPAMLYHAVLFRIFQQVFNMPRDKHNEELQRLGVYIIRQFVQIAPTNPKIYAELLFYKTIREANELESGYSDQFDTGPKAAWTEEEENELRMLYEENQRSPQTDQDVIDWILDNLINKSRTKRGVMKKLKELGLIFKAPTKKSTAAAVNKNLWQHEEDEMLRNLYDEHRLNENCLEIIIQAFGETKSKNNIIKRMIQIHLIADRSEIIPKKPRKRNTKKNEPRNASDSDDDIVEQFDDDNGEQIPTTSGNSKRTRQTKNQQKIKKSSKPKPKKASKHMRTPLDVQTVKSLLRQIDEKYQDAIVWLNESLIEACEDIDETAEDPEDGVPLLPLSELQIDAIDDANFQKLLISLGIQPPIAETEKYWRIPNYLNATDLQMRANVVSGTHIETENVTQTDDGNEFNFNVDEDENNDQVTDEDESCTDAGDSHENFFDKRRHHLDTLVFNKSDNEDDYREPLKPREKKRKTKPKTDNILSDNINKKKQKKKHGKLNIDNLIQTPKNNEVCDDDDNNILDFDSENLRLRLAELEDSDTADQEVNDAFDTLKGPSTSSSKDTNRRSRIRKNVIESDTSDDDNREIGSNASAAEANSNRLSNTMTNIERGNNTEERSDMDDYDQRQSTIGKSLKDRAKRARSDESIESGSDIEVSVHNKKHRADNSRRRRIAVIDDDEDDNN